VHSDETSFPDEHGFRDEEGFPDAPPDVPGVTFVGWPGDAGAGEVWTGFLESDGTPCAVRLVRLPDDPERRGEALAAGRSLTELRHPHLVPVLAVTEVEGGLAVVMTGVPDTVSLSRLLDVRGRLEPGEVVTVGLPIAQALTAAHAAGFGHGSLGPADILLEPNGRPQLAGVGLQALGAPPSGPPQGPDHIAPVDVYRLADLLLDAMAHATGPEAAAVAVAVATALVPDPARRPSAAELAANLAHSARPAPVRMISPPAPSRPANGWDTAVPRGPRGPVQDPSALDTTAGLVPAALGPAALGPPPSAQDVVDDARPVGATGQRSSGGTLTSLLDSDQDDAWPAAERFRRGSAWRERPAARGGGGRVPRRGGRDVQRGPRGWLLAVMAAVGGVAVVVAVVLLNTSGGSGHDVAAAGPASVSPPAGTLRPTDPSPAPASSTTVSPAASVAATAGPPSASSPATGPTANRPTTTRPTAARPATAGPPPEQAWRTVLDGLNAARSRAFQQDDESALADVYQVGSADYTQDLQTLREVEGRGAHTSPLVTHILDLTIRQQGADQVVLRITDQLDGYDFLDAAGNVLAHHDSPGPHQGDVTLVRTAGGWRISDRVPVS